VSRGIPRGPLAARTARKASRRLAAVAVLMSDPPPSADAERSIDNPPNVRSLSTLLSPATRARHAASVRRHSRRNIDLAYE
jgi:hypothetical protein